MVTKADMLCKYANCKCQEEVAKIHKYRDEEEKRKKKELIREYLKLEKEKKVAFEEVKNIQTCMDNVLQQISRYDREDDDWSSEHE